MLGGDASALAGLRQIVRGGGHLVDILRNARDGFDCRFDLGQLLIGAARDAFR